MSRATRNSPDFHVQLLTKLAKVDRPGAVCICGDLPLTIPGLEVDKVGQIRLPLDGAQARKLIKQCSQAPYGKGTKTLVDTDVRRVWELDPARFELTNPKWSELVSSIVDDVQQGLGLDKSKLTAHLYKLLVYEKGSFFLPHQDGEKLDGMVATLVIALPSRHSGGELVVTHEGRQHKITFPGAASGHELSYTAFYADCEHEVRPVKDGYRLCLVYNLALAKTRSKKAIAAPCIGATVTAVGEFLRNWPEGTVQKLAVALDHQYSQEGLSIDTLKGVDRARADVLFDAADQAGCVAHLALVTHWESGSAEGGDYNYDESYRSRRRYGDWSNDGDDQEDDEDDEENEDAGALSGYEMGEVIDEGLSADHWSDRDGNKIPFGAIDLNQQEIISSQPIADWKINREEFEGYTGNAGMTLERWYHRAAVIIWPQRNHFQVLCTAGTEAAIGGLEAMVKKWNRSPKSEKKQERPSCLDFAKAIIDAWGARRFTYSSYVVQDPIDRSVFLTCLQELDAPELVCLFLTQVMPHEDGVQFDKCFPAFCKQHDWKFFESSLTAVMDATSATTLLRNAGSLEILCLERENDAGRIELCRRLAKHLVAAVVRLDRPRRDRKPPDDDSPDDAADVNWSEDAWKMQRVDRAALLTPLIKSLISVGAEEPLARLIDHTLAARSKYELTDVHLKTIFGLEAWLARQQHKPSSAVSRWLKHCRADLEQRTAVAPSRPADYRRAAKLSCNCHDCQELSRFLADPDESVLRLPLAMDRRQHLHQMIDSCGCDVTHVTTRTGRPFTLVCTKTTASYERACQVYSRDCKNLQRLQAIEAKIKRQALDNTAKQFSRAETKRGRSYG